LVSILVITIFDNNQRLIYRFGPGLITEKSIQHNIGLPVCVGIATTKTLAKMANCYAKKKYKRLCVFYAANQELVYEMLLFTGVEDIWGICRQYAALLKRNGIHTAMDVTKVPEEWMRSQMTVVGQRLWNEMRGTPVDYIFYIIYSNSIIYKIFISRFYS